MITIALCHDIINDSKRKLALKEYSPNKKNETMSGWEQHADTKSTKSQNGALIVFRAANK